MDFEIWLSGKDRCVKLMVSVNDIRGLFEP